MISGQAGGAAALPRGLPRLRITGKHSRESLARVARLRITQAGGKGPRLPDDLTGQGKWQGGSIRGRFIK